MLNMTTPAQNIDKRRELLTPVDLAQFLLFRYTGAAPGRNGDKSAVSGNDHSLSKSTTKTP